MTPSRLNWILRYQFANYYNTEQEWERDFNKFKTALVEYDLIHTIINFPTQLIHNK